METHFHRQIAADPESKALVFGNFFESSKIKFIFSIFFVHLFHTLVAQFTQTIQKSFLWIVQFYFQLCFPMFLLFSSVSSSAC